MSQNERTRLFVSTKFSGFNLGAKPLSFAAASGTKWFYAEFSPKPTPEQCDPFVAERIYPALRYPDKSGNFPSSIGYHGTVGYVQGFFQKWLRQFRGQIEFWGDQEQAGWNLVIKLLNPTEQGTPSVFPIFFELPTAMLCAGYAPQVSLPFFAYGNVKPEEDLLANALDHARTLEVAFGKLKIDEREMAGASA